MLPASLPLTASPKRTAFSTASRLATGSTPGSAMSTALACVLGGAPNAVDAPENIFERVFSCAWVSRPMTISHFIDSRSPGVPGGPGGSNLYPRRGPRMPVGRLLVLVRDVQHARFREVVAHDLQADRQALPVEAARDRHAREPRQVGGRGEDVV